MGDREREPEATVLSGDQAWPSPGNGVEPGRRRVLFLDSGTGFGGPTSFLYSLLSHLDRARFDPVVAFYSATTGPNLDRIRSLGVPIVFLDDRPAPSVPRFVRRVSRGMHGTAICRVRRLVKFGIDVLTRDLPRTVQTVGYLKRESFALVVLNNDVHYHVPGALAARLMRIPLVCRKAGGIGEGRWIKKVLTPCVDLFISISRATEADQRAQRGTKRVVTIYEGVDISRFSPRQASAALRSELRLVPGKKVVGCLARFERGKGQPEFLRAAASVLGQYRDVVFLVSGGGDPNSAEVLEELQAEARRMEVTDRIVFAEWRDDVPAVLALLDVFVHVPTTFLEGLGITNLEAMAMAKPTVVSRNGGLPDAVVDGVTGFVVPPGDIEALTQALLRLLADEALARRLGENARRRIEEHFDIAKNVRSMERQFEEAIALADVRRQWPVES